MAKNVLDLSITKKKKLLSLIISLKKKLIFE